MKAWMLTDRHGVDALSIVDRPTPEPGPHQVLIRVRGVSLNYRDLLFVEGNATPNHPLPLIPCGDCAGEVAAVGTGTTRVAVGDHVAATFSRWQAGKAHHGELFDSTPGGLYDVDLGVAPRDGVLAEYALFDEERVVKTPPHLTLEEAATLPLAGVTAWHALFVNTQLQPGDSVLIQGTGGVASFAIQLARAAGYRVIVTSRSDEKLERARRIGAHDAINYRSTPAWDARARELTNGLGVDLVVDVSGGELGRSVAALRTGGQVSLIGFLSGFSATLDVFPMLMKNARVQGIFVGSRDMLDALVAAVSLHQIHPVVDRVFSFEDARKALAELKRGDHFGKLVIRVP